MPNPLRVVALTIALLCTPVWAADDAASADRERQVRDFIDAFNEQDSAAMARLVTEDVEWLNVDGRKIAVETAGKEQLVRSMDAYFKSCTSCRSTLGDIVATPDRASAIEIARWESAQGPRTQRGISVYEFAGALIRRVYYFPAER